MRLLWLIDGYNVILGLAGNEGLDDDELRRRRERLERLAAAFARRRDQEVRIVYDGRRLPVSHPGARREEHLSVVFAEPPAEADDLIHHLAAREGASGRAVRVATDDRELAVRVRSAGAEVVPVAELADRLRPATPGGEALPDAAGMADVAEHFLAAHRAEGELERRAEARRRRLQEWLESREPQGGPDPAGAPNGPGSRPDPDPSGRAEARRRRGRRRQERRLRQQKPAGGRSARRRRRS